MTPQTIHSSDAQPIVEALAEQTASRPPAPRASDPLLRALRRAGTSHLYLDTASVAEAMAVNARGTQTTPAELDGNTVNQPLVVKVLNRHVEGHGEHVRSWERRLRDAGFVRSGVELDALLYCAVLGRIASEFHEVFAGAWETSVQIHMGLLAEPEAMRDVAHVLHRTAPHGLVKVPFSPAHPDCLLVARDLEQQDIPVNLTSTFSARQVVAAALLANVRRTNVFLSRINKALEARLLGEHVALTAQQELLALRRRHGVRSRLIVASVDDWRTITTLAGCDAFTAPCRVYDDLLASGTAPDDVERAIETTLAPRAAAGARALAVLGAAAIDRLHVVEPEFVAFLVDLAQSPDYRRMSHGDALRERFEAAGFGDFFHSPSAAERREIEAGKLPEIEAPITRSLALDTLFSLKANADFARQQTTIDEAIARHRSTARSAS